MAPLKDTDMESFMLHSMKYLEYRTEYVNIDGLFDGVSLRKNDCVERWG